MNQPSKGVFLSYASEDSDAAARLAAALAAAGIDVWFDKSEIRGGDAWDQKIRQQIRDCALFVPIISAHTQARPEGYFRLEWKLAVDRSHLMVAEKAFLVPVVVDATTEPEALVPAQFRDVQWTRILAGEVKHAFVNRLAALLNQRVASDGGSSERAFNHASPSHLPSTVAAISVAAVLALAIGLAMLGGWSWHKPFPRVATSTTGTSIVATPALPENSVAVLPFTDMSKERDQEYFAEGLSEELIDRLTAVPTLHVAARTSSFYFKGKSEDIPTIARRLMVTNILEGSVRKSGSHVRITVQLVRADSGYQLWSETFERQLGDIFRLQDDIAARVLQALKASLGPGATESASDNQNGEAYVLLTQARAMERRGVQDAPTVVEYLQRAISLDRTYASAWAALAMVRVRQFDGPATSTYASEAHQAANRALALNPNLADAHLANALVHYYLDWDWIGAEQAFRRALELEPRNADILSFASLAAMTLGNIDEARNRIQRALDADPLNSRAYIYLGYMNYYAGRYPQAEAVWRKASELDPEWTEINALMGLTQLAQGNAELALSTLSRVPNGSERAYGLAIVYWALGRRVDADAALAKVERDNANDGAYGIAQVYAYRHEADKSFLWLERAYRQRDTTLPHIKGDPLFKNLETDPRFKAFLRQMNLPE